MKSWTERGSGKCPGCSAAYNNRYKPENCVSCGYFLGGSYEPKPKKSKVSTPSAVRIDNDIYSARTSNRDDRCIVMKEKGLWMCFHEKCKGVRATFAASNCLHEFSCDHVESCKKEAAEPESVITDENDSVDHYIASDSIKEVLRDCQRGTTVLGAKIGPKMFTVFGPPTASNPVGFCHIKAITNDADEFVRFACCGKACKGRATKSKQLVVNAMCIHLHVLNCFGKELIPESQPPSVMATTASSSVSDTVSPSPSTIEPTTASSSVSNTVSPSPSTIEPTTASSSAIETTTEPASLSTRRSTVLAASKRKIPYHLDPSILQEIMKRDANSLLKEVGGWPDTYIPTEEICSMCLGQLSQPKVHPGQSGNSYLVSSGFPFKKVAIYVKKCSQCGTMYQAFPLHIGLFNICDKILLSVDILLELREHFKKGHPLKNSIEAKMNVLFLKNQEVQIGYQEAIYLKELVYHGFYCFEALTERDMNDVVCGICGVCPEVCLGDGNEKNCCSNSQIKYEEAKNQKPMLSLEEFLGNVKMRLVERTVYTRNMEQFEVYTGQIPPIIAPSMSGLQVVNTENKKNSIYLRKKKETSVADLGDPAILHKLVMEQVVKMEDLPSYEMERIKDICKDCSISTSTKSKELLIGDLLLLYESLVIGLSPCHTFSKLPGKTGGFYHLVCRHGCTVASKFLTLTESVRDAADLYLSIKFQPVVFINDTPCGFVRHMQCRDIRTAKQLWGEREGCFEKPKLNCKPQENHDVPEVIPLEHRDTQTLPSHSGREESLSHPVANTRERYVLGDRFHASTNPHKSPLCEYHNVNLCLQANALKTSIQESQNNRKNKKRLRSSCLQTFEHHFFYNFLMDFYQNEEIVNEQKRNLSKRGLEFRRDNLLRFTISSQ